MPMTPAQTDRLIERAQGLSRPLAPQPTRLEPTRSPLAGIRAVLFDVYGTLLISGSGDVGTALRSARADALVEASAAVGRAWSLPVAEQALVLLQEQIQRAHAARRREGIAVPEVDILQVWRLVQVELKERDMIAETLSPEDTAGLALEYECRVNPVWPMPRAQAVIGRLRAAGIPLGIVSNAQFYTPLLFPALMKHSLQDLGFMEELCAWSWRHLEAKPSPALFQGPVQVLKDRGIEPHQVLYVGNDLLNDIWAATEAGCKTALFAGDGRSLRLREEEPRCAGLQPSLILTEWGHLPALLSVNESD